MEDWELSVKLPVAHHSNFALRFLYRVHFGDAPRAQGAFKFQTTDQSLSYLALRVNLAHSFCNSSAWWPCHLTIETWLVWELNPALDVKSRPCVIFTDTALIHFGTGLNKWQLLIHTFQGVHRSMQQRSDTFRSLWNPSWSVQLNSHIHTSADRLTPSKDSTVRKKYRSEKMRQNALLMLRNDNASKQWETWCQIVGIHHKKQDWSRVSFSCELLAGVHQPGTGKWVTRRPEVDDTRSQ